MSDPIITDKKTPGFLSGLRLELAAIIAWLTFIVFQFGGDYYLKDIESTWFASLMFVLLFGVCLTASFGVVRHANALAHILGEPYGTLILTISVIGIEVSFIAAVMLTGESAPTLARDTMFAVLMIVLNGLVGIALLLGGLKHGEQDYNLQGARSFLAILLPLAVLSFILPDFTTSTEDASFSPLQAVFFAIVTILLYGIFLGMQTTRDRAFFNETNSSVSAITDDELAKQPDSHFKAYGPVFSIGYHALFLVLTLLPIVLLSKRVAKVIDFGIVEIGAPVALGGVLISLLVLTPESLAALEAALKNKLQRAVNLLLGSALATIGLTLPIVLAIGLISGKSVTVGLSPAFMTLLSLTLIMSVMTFGGTRTNMLQGAAHLVIFLTYLMLIFSP